MILAIVRHVCCVPTGLHMDSRSGPWLYLRVRLAFGIFQLLLQIKQLELKRGELLLTCSVGLFDDEQPLHQVDLGLEQVALMHPVQIAIGINARRLRRHSLAASLASLVSQPALVRATMFAVVGVGFRVANDRCLFDTLAFRVHLAGPGADGLKRDRLPLLEQLIDGVLDQSHRALAPGLVVLLQPRAVGVLL